MLGIERTPEDCRWLDEAEREDEERAATAFTQLPLAGSTRECPKCLFGMLTYKYLLCFYSSHWSRYIPPAGLFFRAWRPPTRKLMVRQCPQCGADTFERPADSVSDYEADAA
jgi:rubredoxin